MTDLLNDRLPPQNIEAEQAVLGAIFLQPSALTLASEVLIPDDFYRMSHQKIYNAMLVLGDRGEPVDLVTVTSELANTDLLEEVGGISYLTDIANSVPTAANIEYYAKIVEEKSILRRLIRTATTIAQDGYTREDEVEDLLSEAEKRLWKWHSAKTRVPSKILRTSLSRPMIISNSFTIEKVISREFQQGLRSLTG